MVLVVAEATDSPHLELRRIQRHVNAGKNTDPPEVVPPGDPNQDHMPFEGLCKAA